MAEPEPKKPTAGDFGVFIVPYLFGPAIRKFGTVLLWHGRITPVMPAWIVDDPINCFDNTGDWAFDQNHPLLPLFDSVRHYFYLAQEQAIAEMEMVKPLREFIRHVHFVSPGTRETYADWGAHESSLAIAARMLENTQVVNVAAVEFIWRCWELSLELGPKPDLILGELTSRANALGDRNLLLAECALNRHWLGKYPGVPYATDLDDSVAILSDVGRSAPALTESQAAEARATELSFLLFDSVTAPHVPLIESASIERYGNALTDHVDALDEARRKCRVHSRSLIAQAPRPEQLAVALRDVLVDLEAEMSAVLAIDRNTWQGLLDKLSENSGLLAMIAGLIGSWIAGLPDVVTASVGATALSVAGTSALKMSRERAKAIADSTWSFVYYLRR